MTIRNWGIKIFPIVRFSFGEYNLVKEEPQRKGVPLSARIPNEMSDLMVSKREKACSNFTCKNVGKNLLCTHPRT